MHSSCFLLANSVNMFAELLRLCQASVCRYRKTLQLSSRLQQVQPVLSETNLCCFTVSENCFKAQKDIKYQRGRESVFLGVSAEITAPTSYNCSERVAPRTNYSALAAAAKVISSPLIGELKKIKYKKLAFLSLPSVARSSKWGFKMEEIKWDLRIRQRDVSELLVTCFKMTRGSEYCCCWQKHGEDGLNKATPERILDGVSCMY